MSAKVTPAGVKVLYSGDLPSSRAALDVDGWSHAMVSATCDNPGTVFLRVLCDRSRSVRDQSGRIEPNGVHFVRVEQAQAQAQAVFKVIVER